MTNADRYQKFMKEHLRVIYLTTDEEVKATAKYIRSLEPSLVGLDVETASKNGSFGTFNGSLRTIQLGFDEPERGIGPLQVVIDCHSCDPRPFLPLLRTRNVEKQIHYMDFEQEWALLHLGISIGQIYDTCIASQEIQKGLKEVAKKEGLKAAQKIDPDWAPKRSAKDEDEEGARLRQIMDEEGLKAAQKILPNWEPHRNKLSTLATNYLHLELPKENQVSDWGRKELQADQLVYAAMDVATLPELTEKLKEVAAKLTSTTKQGEEISVTEAIDRRIAWVKTKIYERATKRKRENNDDTKRLARAVKRATTRDELDRIAACSRQMTILAENSSDLAELLKERRRELA